MNFYKFFLLLWVIFALLDPDPDSESGSTDPIESGSNPDPDPEPCFFDCLFFNGDKNVQVVSVIKWFRIRIGNLEL
jgi:hypothetical protein